MFEAFSILFLLQQKKQVKFSMEGFRHCRREIENFVVSLATAWHRLTEKTKPIFALKSSENTFFLCVWKWFDSMQFTTEPSVFRGKMWKLFLCWGRNSQTTNDQFHSLKFCLLSAYSQRELIMGCTSIVFSIGWSYEFLLWKELLPSKIKIEWIKSMEKWWWYKTEQKEKLFHFSIIALTPLLRRWVIYKCSECRTTPPKKMSNKSEKHCRG